MSALARWCARRRIVVAVLWLVAVLALAGGALTAGGAFTDSVTLPDSESSTAYAVLADAGLSSDTESGTVVWQTDGASVVSPEVQAVVAPVLQEIGTLPGVVSVTSPYSEAGAAQVDVDTGTAFAEVAMDPDATAEQITAVVDTAHLLDGDGLTVETGGIGFFQNPSAGGATELIGILAALVVLLLVFRSVWAAVLPIVVGVAGVLSSVMVVLLLSHVVDLASQTPTMGALIGLGVGIDYALFIVNRYRKALVAGRSVPDAVEEAVTTSGRAVVFAGGTVVIALLGMLVLGVGLLTGLAVGAAITVLLTVMSAVTLLPALLALLGTRTLSRAQRRAVAAGDTTPAPAGVWGRWASGVQRHPAVVAVASLAVLVVLAVPALSIRLGSADDSSDPAGSATLAYSQMMGEAFGPGFDAALVVVGQTPDAPAQQAFAALATTFQSTDGVASVTTAPLPADGGVSLLTVAPTTTAQAEATADLVDQIRTQVVPAAEQGTDLQVYVGGTTASNIDFAETLTSKLPLFLALIAALGFLLLAVAFRSVLVPLIGALGNLLTLAISLGAITALFQWGWASELIGAGGPAPVEPIVPILVVGIAFGLAKDYQVFLVSRMHEEWGANGDNRRAVRVGMAETGRVIAAAAVIMACVFASFGAAGERVIAELGVGLGVAVLVDAFVLRMCLTPAVMHLLGRSNWWYPRWAERITPQLSVEGGPVHAPAPDVEAPSPRQAARVGQA